MPHAGNRRKRLYPTRNRDLVGCVRRVVNRAPPRPPKKSCTRADCPLEDDRYRTNPVTRVFSPAASVGAGLPSAGPAPPPASLAPYLCRRAGSRWRAATVAALSVGESDRPDRRSSEPSRVIEMSPKRSSSGEARGVQSDRPTAFAVSAGEQGWAGRRAVSARVGACWSSPGRPRPARRS